MFSVSKCEPPVKRNDPFATGKQFRDICKLNRHKPSPPNRSIAANEIRKELIDPHSKNLDKKFKQMFANKKKKMQTAASGKAKPSKKAGSAMTKPTIAKM